LLIVNFNELDQNDHKRKERIKRKKAVLHSTTTIEEGDDIVVVTFFIAKPLKKATIIAVTIFCNKAIKEGDESCRTIILFYFSNREKGEGSKLSSFSSLQHHHKRR